MLTQFKCSCCGSGNLAYQSYVKCITSVHIKDDETFVYANSVADTEDEMGSENGFCCGDCGQMVDFCDFGMETERDLIDFLKMSDEDRQKQQNEYELQSELYYQSIQQAQEARINNYLNGAED